MPSEGATLGPSAGHEGSSQPAADLSQRALPFPSTHTIGPRSKQRVLAICLILFLAGLLTRLPLRPRYISTSDAAQFALGIHNFDPAKHQPHPPGYILFVGLLRAVRGVVPDDDSTLILMSTLFSALSAVLLFLFARKFLEERHSAVFAACLWLTNPLLWYYSETGEIYPAAAFASLATAFCVLSFWRRPTERTAILAGATFAACGGLRPDQVLLLLPLFLLPFWRSRQCRRYLPLAGVVAVAVYLTWYVPLMESAGGYRAYSRLVKGEFLESVRRTSFFWGASPFMHARMLVSCAVWVVVGTLPGWLLVPLLLATRKRRITGPRLTVDEWLFLVLWAAPFLLFFGLVHAGRPGYVLAVLPPILLLISRFTAIQCSPSPKGSAAFASLMVISILINTCFFFAVPAHTWTPEPADNPERSAWWNRVHLLPYLLENQVHCCVYDDIRRSDAQLASSLSAVRSASSGNSSVAIVVLSEGSWMPSWRVVMNHFPNVPVYGVFGLNRPIIGTLSRPGPFVVSVGYWQDTSVVVAGDRSIQSREPVCLYMGIRDRVLLVIPSGSDIRLDAAPGNLNDATPRIEGSRVAGFTVVPFDVGASNTLTVTGRARSIVIHR